MSDLIVGGGPHAQNSKDCPSAETTTRVSIQGRSQLKTEGGSVLWNAKCAENFSVTHTHFHI